jgi:CBS domain-containing protein
MSTSLRREWVAFRRPGRLAALAAAVAAVIGLCLLASAGVHVECPGPCPPTPVADDGTIVSDRFWFYHRDLGPEGSITVRMTSMTGTITYPPPDHDQIVPGLVPWAKAGIIIKDGLRQGSPYAALMMTGSHGLRLQYNYQHDIAGANDGSSERWLRLTRSGDTITAFDSSDGHQWDTVATVALDGLPDVVQVGLFATSPGDLTLRKVGLGGAIDEVRFTQAVGVFDNVAVEGGTSGAWQSDPVGEMNHTDWEKHHHASGAVEDDGVVTVSGTGDIGPRGEDGPGADPRLLGLIFAVIIVAVVSARYGAATVRESPTRSTMAARAVILGAATFITGLVAVGVARPVGGLMLANNGAAVPPLPVLTEVRVVIGLAAVVALGAVLTYGLGVWLRRGWLAILVSLSVIALPYGVTAVPLLADPVAEWLLRITPAAGFTVQQTAVEYAQVTAHYAPHAGYFPLPWWAGLAVLCAYAAVILGTALGRAPATSSHW